MRRFAPTPPPPFPPPQSPPQLTVIYVRNLLFYDHGTRRWLEAGHAWIQHDSVRLPDYGFAQGGYQAGGTMGHAVGPEQQPWLPSNVPLQEEGYGYAAAAAQSTAHPIPVYTPASSSTNRESGNPQDPYTIYQPDPALGGSEAAVDAGGVTAATPSFPHVDPPPPVPDVHAGENAGEIPLGPGAQAVPWICQWKVIRHGHEEACNAPLFDTSRLGLKAHLEQDHGVDLRDAAAPRGCEWGECRNRPMQVGAIPRHIRDRHIPDAKEPEGRVCPRCDMTFARPDALGRHLGKNRCKK